MFSFTPLWRFYRLKGGYHTHKRASNEMTEDNNIFELLGKCHIQTNKKKYSCFTNQVFSFSFCFGIFFQILNLFFKGYSLNLQKFIFKKHLFSLVRNVSPVFTFTMQGYICCDLYILKTFQRGILGNSVIP